MPFYPLKQLTDDTLIHLRGTTRDELNVLGTILYPQAANFLDNLTLQYGLNGATIGSMIVIGDETMHVVGATPGNNSLTVLRAQDDSLGAAHSPGDVVTVDPLWPRQVVMNTLRDEIRSWGPQLFQVQQMDLQVQAWVRGYDLSGIELYHVLSVRAPSPPVVGTRSFSVDARLENQDLAWPDVEFSFSDAAPISDFPSGKALFIRSESTLDTPGTMHVVYAAPFDVDTSWADDTDIIGDCGVDSQDLDIAPYGAAARLLAFNEIRRVQTNVAGQTRNATEVPPLAIIQAAQAFKQMRDSRINDARMRLQGRWPIVMSNY